jgi:hypothetical protein
MRHIDLRLFDPPPGWTDRAQSATAALYALSTHEERMSFIRSHPDLLRELRNALVEKFGPKCWFTDAPEFVAKLDVEHFRPKAKALNRDGSERGGYWWLAFDGDNLKLCGQIPNREHKLCYFPLHRNSRIADERAVSWRDETPTFLDPANLVDVGLVVYGEDGGVHPRADATDWEKERVETTDELMGLSKYQPLVEARQKVWQKCTNLIQGYLRAVAEERASTAPSPALAERKNNIQMDLKKMTDPQEPFASVAAACLRLSGHPFAQAIATQQHGG